MKFIFTFLATVLLSVSVYAGNDNDNKNTKNPNVVVKTENVNMVQISGNVFDEKSNETLAGAAIYINGEKVYSDLDGNFTLSNIAPGKHVLKVELISYETNEKEINVIENSKINIHLVQK